MSSSIRISEETKAKLEAVKREGETFDELLNRLAVDRTEADVRAFAGGGGEGLEEHMRNERESAREAFDERTR